MKAFSFVVIFGALFGLSGCSAATDGPDTDPSPESTEQAASANACHTKCNKCPPNQVCAQYCVLSGNCGSSCNIIALCIQGYMWDDKSCSCIPDPNAGEACGSSVCPAGQVCCNSSCGICTDPGGFCTQQVCSSTL
jgi:hypothetical protein